MKHNSVPEIILSAALIGLLLLLLHPFGDWMPNTIFMMTVACLLVAFGIFMGFIFQERSRDERERLHRGEAGRTAFLLGSGVLVIGIVIQSFTHAIDPFLVLALAVMILGKVVARAYHAAKS